MYEIIYEGNFIPFNTAKEVIQKIIEAHNECKEHELQIVTVMFNSIMIEVGVGDKHDRLLLVFSNKNTNEDTMISYHEGAANNIITFDRKNFIPFDCREHNLIPLDIAIEVLIQIILTESLSNIIKWYSS